MASFAFLAVFLASAFIFASSSKAKEAEKNAHDLIMEANRHILTKRSVKDQSAEDKIVKINEEAGNDLFEGDIKMSKAEIKENYEGTGKRNFIKDMRYSWRTRTIPYIVIHPDSTAYSKIKEALDEIKKVVPCLTFRQKTSTDTAYIKFYQGVGCWSPIGKRIPETAVSLGHMCLSKSTIIHETMHALGFFHEQARSDRDSYITINYENIQSNQQYNFKRQKAHELLNIDTMYDYKSIMHYGKTTFTLNGKDTVNAKFDKAMPLGSTKLSETDILELNKVYQCHVKGSAIWSEWTSWSACYSYGTTGRRTRQKYCFSDQKSLCTGADYYGVKDEHKYCSSYLEPMNGHWGNWGSWGSCSKACDEGIYTRHRQCNNPSPSNGGANCKGSKSETKLCRIKKCNQKWYDTSFENGWGMWKQTTADGGLQWTRQAGATLTPNTGPEGDHTTHNGYYAYVEAGVINHKKSAILVSSQFKSNFGPKCFTFFYNMNGKDMGSLKIILKSTSGRTMQIWEKEGHQGTDWKAAAADIPVMQESFHIQIKATIGYSPYSDIAIDDIFIDDGACPIGIETCNDHNSNCANWARNGECHKNTKWMLQNCCKSCTGVIGECTKDSYGTSCQGFAKDYGCTYNGQWMWSNCCKSCKGCLNKSYGCDDWAKSGECTKNPVWMKENCKISCKVCKA